jgi:hypothetical protein
MRCTLVLGQHVVARACAQPHAHQAELAGAVAAHGVSQVQTFVQYGGRGIVNRGPPGTMGRVSSSPSDSSERSWGGMRRRLPPLRGRVDGALLVSLNPPVH